ncbi:hypothetical protein PRUPE_2G303700 [Prunus persica]|uniref:V-SNARE coiled-coil homology domain-containing protein n=1 Tax=Prunus persica TaxID=3760 RepID=A0A251QNX0_PRUPE|nr:hypothetical protein PRUPE_2G303700 [Prunus persica]
MSSIFSHGNSSILQVLDRGEKIELLVDKTDNLRSQAQDFRTQGTKMKRKMWFQNMKIKLITCGDHHSHRLCDIFVNLPWF